MSASLIDYFKRSFSKEKEILTIDKLIETIQTDFRFPHKPKQKTYATRFGNVSVVSELYEIEQRDYFGWLQITDKVSKTIFHHCLTDNEIPRNPTLLTLNKHKAGFLAKSRLKVTLPESNQAAKLSQQVQEYVQEYNERHGIHFLFFSEKHNVTVDPDKI